MSPLQLAWVSTDGAPLLVLPRAILSRWGGLEDPTSADVDDYIGLVQVDQDAFGLMLGDAPYPTAWCPSPETGGGYLIRWLWGDSIQAVRLAMLEVPEELWTPEPLIFDTRDGELILFDAMYPGKAPIVARYPREELLIGGLSIQLGGGRYQLATANVEPDADTCLMIHRLLPIQ